MKSRSIGFVIATGLFAFGCSRNAPAPVVEKMETAPPVEVAPPATVPAATTTTAAQSAPAAPKGDQAARIATLVEQLGDQDYGRREAATRELAEVGKAALPALEAAAKDPDAERASRAKGLITRLNASDEEAKAPEIPGLAEAIRATQGNQQIVIDGNAAQGGIRLGVQAVGGGGAGNVSTRFEMVNGESRRTIENKHGSAVIAEGKNGFSLTLTPKKCEPMTFSAANRAEFAKKYPNLYAKYFGGEGE